MNAKTFLEAFTEKAYSDPRIIEKYWNDWSDFTKYIMSEVIDRIIATECKLSHEYFRIDASGWISKSDEIESEAKELHLNPHNWNLKIAVEHENNRRDWTDEVTKLLHIRCPLKVVIGYTDSRYRDDNALSDINKISQVKKWMEEIDAVEQMPTDEEFLIVLGNAVKRPDTIKPEKSIDYRGYLLQKDSNTHDLDIVCC